MPEHDDPEGARASLGHQADRPPQGGEATGGHPVKMPEPDETVKSAKTQEWPCWEGAAGAGPGALGPPPYAGGNGALVCSCGLLFVFAGGHFRALGPACNTCPGCLALRG